AHRVTARLYPSSYACEASERSASERSASERSAFERSAFERSASEISVWGHAWTVKAGSALAPARDPPKHGTPRLLPQIQTTYVEDAISSLRERGWGCLFTH
ncbi:MAG: hypothetical protein K2X38_09835, partial [Gemmataceae bacterium]|nr:hypothetical protein [Gemmataceae bacterium]